MIPHEHWSPNYAGLLYLAIFGLLFGVVGYVCAVRESRRRKVDEARKRWRARFTTRTEFLKKFLEQFPEDTTPTPRAEDDDD